VGVGFFEGPDLTMKSFLLLFVFILAVLEFELRALYLLGKHFTIGTVLPALVLKSLYKKKRASVRQIPLVAFQRTLMGGGSSCSILPVSVPSAL
jgi:hypothetical protein